MTYPSKLSLQTLNFGLTLSPSPLVYLVCLMLYILVNSYGHARTVDSPGHTIFLCKLEQTANQYFVHILSPVMERRRMTVEIIS